MFLQIPLSQIPSPFCVPMFPFHALDISMPNLSDTTHFSSSLCSGGGGEGRRTKDSVAAAAIAMLPMTSVVVVVVVEVASCVESFCLRTESESEWIGALRVRDRDSGSTMHASTLSFSYVKCGQSRVGLLDGFWSGPSVVITPEWLGSHRVIVAI